MKWKRILKRSAFVVLVLLFAWFQFAYWTSTNDCGRSIPPGAERIKAIRYCEYGPPDVLKIEEIEKPMPKEDELLVRVRAASLNFIDAGLVLGPPFDVRFAEAKVHGVRARLRRCNRSCW